MEHLSQLEQKATTSVSRREHKGPREDKVTKRESLGSFSMRDKSWRTGSPEMWVVGSIEKELNFFFKACRYDTVKRGVLYTYVRYEDVQKVIPWRFGSLIVTYFSLSGVLFLCHWHQFWHLYKKPENLHSVWVKTRHHIHPVESIKDWSCLTDSFVFIPFH